MGTCYSKRSACYNLKDCHQTITNTDIYLLNPPETPATLRRFSSLRHSVKSLSSMAHHRRSLRYKPITIIMSPNKHSTIGGGHSSSRKKHRCIIQYNASKEALV
ncbi:unnamed protein product [Adineta steineri]|uniref:Uncharacterized protein n=1 Tax=Adineta steineri TaxID=433720 RepID=A0A818JY90_9BILA|nr:unnamed protein product [Adineta steineri]CAF3549439.1 unnamed protein product [Adineta steineri]